MMAKPDKVFLFAGQMGEGQEKGLKDSFTLCPFEI
jgi:hypothetical protein